MLRLGTSACEPLELAERRPQTSTLRSPQPGCLEMPHARGPRLRSEGEAVRAGGAGAGRDGGGSARGRRHVIRGRRCGLRI